MHVELTRRVIERSPDRLHRHFFAVARQKAELKEVQERQRELPARRGAINVDQRLVDDRLARLCRRFPTLHRRTVSRGAID